MRNLKVSFQEPQALPQLGILTHVEELSSHDMIYIFHRLQNGVSLRIERDENRFWDDNALAVYFKGFKLGYVSKKTSNMVKKFLLGGRQVSATIKSMSKSKFQPMSEMDIQIHVH